MEAQLTQLQNELQTLADALDARILALEGTVGDLQSQMVALKTHNP